MQPREQSDDQRTSTSQPMSDTYETSHDIEARLNQLCGDAEDATANLASCRDEKPLMADPTVSHHIVRTQRTESSITRDTLTGSFRCRFEPAQTIYILHVPIYPPMQSAPEVETFCNRENVVARTTSTSKFGIRIELKRSANSVNNESVIAEVIASSK